MVALVMFSAVVVLAEGEVADLGELTADGLVSSSDVEEVIVTAARPEPGIVLPLEYMQQTYVARGKGSCLFRRGNYEEAFPYLLAAAKRGFKLAQARVGYLYQQGIGVGQDPYAAVGWFAVAAEGKTHPEIRNYFKDVWRRIPESHLPRFEAVAEEYRTRYGAEAHRVACDLDRAMGSFMPVLTCRFADEAVHNDYRELIALVRGETRERQFVPGSMEPLRANSGAC
ncbi:MAG: hypothetical protein OXQ90_05350 [Gammaproteobacteria bacterium]|nr:hypothetical protein [Gammaproteobacteria bacterium]